MWIETIEVESSPSLDLVAAIGTGGKILGHRKHTGSFSVRWVRELFVWEGISPFLLFFFFLSLPLFFDTFHLPFIVFFPHALSLRQNYFFFHLFLLFLFLFLGERVLLRFHHSWFSSSVIANSFLRGPGLLFLSFFFWLFFCFVFHKSNPRHLSLLDCGGATGTFWTLWFPCVCCCCLPYGFFPTPVYGWILGSWMGFFSPLDPIGYYCPKWFVCPVSWVVQILYFGYSPWRKLTSFFVIKSNIVLFI